MSSKRSFWAAFVSLVVGMKAYGQGALPHVQMNSLPEAPVPAVALELVTGEVQVVQTPEQRAQIVQLLARCTISVECPRPCRTI